MPTRSFLPTTRRLLSGIALLSAFAGAAPNLNAQGGPSPVVRAAVQGIEGMLNSTGEPPLLAFAQQHLAASYRATFAGDSLLRHLRALRTSVGDVGAATIMRDAEGFVLNVEGTKPSAVRFALDSAGKITRLHLTTPSRGSGALAPSPWTGITWDNFQSTVARAAASGFDGVIVARRNGQVVARTAMGHADSTTQRPTALNTVYCIGSQPMDFTMTAILLLGQRGKLTLDDSITRFFDNVPADKRGITIRQLLTGRSGLVDFFHIGGVDWDHDLAWITRDEAVRRMMASTLRFPPGTARGHSHAAYVLLSAVIEKVSGQTYQEFLRRELLQPLGMTRTGFYGESLGLSVGEFAVGGGPNSVGLPNIAPNWGPTSWLIMGSGGMVSTLDDMDRFYQSIAGGTLLTGEWAKFQQGRRAGAGGSDRGYFIYHVTDGAGTSIMLITNMSNRARNTPAMTRAFEELVLGPGSR